MPTQPPPPTPPRYHVRRLTPECQAQHPGLVFVRLTCMPPAVWEQVEAFLKQQGFRAF